MSAWRQAVAIAVLPGTAAILVPAVIVAAGDGPDPGWGGGGLIAGLSIAAGTALAAAGFALWAWTVRLFARIGRGTLAPWDPTRRLVVAGPYRHVRNPMISAVLAVLVGEGLLLGAPGVLIWAVAFLAINWTYFVLSEEPGLERRFGADYRAYKSAVPRWLPRRTPWEGSDPLGSDPKGSEGP